MPVFLEEVKRIGFSGVQNFPTVGLCDGQFRQNLEETGMGYGLEVDMIRSAHEAGLLTTPYVFDADQARAMAEAGADVVVAHMGLTTKGAIGADDGPHPRGVGRAGPGDPRRRRRGATRTSSSSATAVRSPSPTTPSTSSTTRTGVAGFFGASSMERLPTEVAITENMRRFKRIARTAAAG